MAMLAEKRQRTKWCLNPMGNDWAKDENKFGLKMLQKMGWEPGTGLGSRGQGRTEIIKLNVKSDTRGLGCQVKDITENWKENLESFDNLLAQLNGNTKSSEGENETLKLPSLEEKSKASRARVHYHKFTRGKDVSKYSPNDLKCILPISKTKNETEPIHSQNNMYEYFKNKNKKQEVEVSDYVEGEQSIQIQIVDKSLESNPLDEKIRKKKKKRKNLENEDGLSTSGKREKKKSKFSENIEPEVKDPVEIEATDINEDYISSIPNDDSVVIPKKSKKKKKKRSKNEIDMEES